MPLKRLKKKSIKRLVEKRVAKAIDEYEKTKANLDNAGSSGGNSENVGGTVNVQGFSHKELYEWNISTFNDTEGVVGLRRWIEKVEQVFEICKCAEEDKVMFVASTFEGRALTWMEQELWTLTLKGDDIEAYNNHFHELALMCPDLVPNEKKKVERCIRGFPERIKGNITYPKSTTLHEAINMARELVKQAVQGKAARPQLMVEATLGTYHSAIGARHIISQNVTCFGCGEKGHYRDKCPRGRNPQNKGARGRAYLMRTEEPQQDPKTHVNTLGPEFP
ncbi:putative reverse transcriptase domain-containing protein [Tanacetum coccineum]